MTLGIGVDIVAITRMKEILKISGQSFIKKVFTDFEKQRLEKHPDQAAHAAMIFAGKEAVIKSFQISWDFGIQLKEIEIRNGKYGEPIPVLSGRFSDIASEKRVTNVQISLSYDGDYAIAVASIFGNNDGLPENNPKDQLKNYHNVELKLNELGN